MKTLKTMIATIALMVCTLTATAQPMSYAAMRNNARFLTDRMAYTLGLSSALLDDLYYINFDYICGVNDYLDDVAMGYRYDDYMSVVYERDYALQRLLTPGQWAILMTYDYFYRPISFVNRAWRFAIYAFDRRPNYFYYRTPRLYTSYRGGRFFHGMRPAPHRNVSGHRPGFRLEPHGGGGHTGNAHRPGVGNRPGGDNHRPSGDVNRPNGDNHRPDMNNRPSNGGNDPNNNNGNVNRPDNDNRPSGTVNGRPSGSSDSSRGQSSVSGNRGGRSESSVRGSSSSSRSSRSTRSSAGYSSSNSSTRSSSSVSRSNSPTRSSSSVSRGSSSSSRSSSATRGGGSSRGGRR